MNDFPDSPRPSPGPQGLRAAFLIRCWIEDDGWRYSLESIATRRRRSYLSLAAVLEGIATELSAGDADGGRSQQRNKDS